MDRISLTAAIPLLAMRTYTVSTASFSKDILDIAETARLTFVMTVWPPCALTKSVTRPGPAVSRVLAPGISRCQEGASGSPSLCLDSSRSTSPSTTPPFGQMKRFWLGWGETAPGGLTDEVRHPRMIVDAPRMTIDRAGQRVRRRRRSSGHDGCRSYAVRKWGEERRGLEKKVG